MESLVVKYKKVQMFNKFKELIPYCNSGIFYLFAKKGKENYIAIDVNEEEVRFVELDTCRFVIKNILDMDFIKLLKEIDNKNIELKLLKEVIYHK